MNLGARVPKHAKVCPHLPCMTNAVMGRQACAFRNTVQMIQTMLLEYRSLKKMILTKYDLLSLSKKALTCPAVRCIIHTSDVFSVISNTSTMVAKSQALTCPTRWRT